MTERGDETVQPVGEDEGSFATRRRRADSLRNEERIMAAARRLLEHSPDGDALRHRRRRGRLPLDRLPALPGPRGPGRASSTSGPRTARSHPLEEPLPPGRLGRRRPLALDAIHVFDAVPPALLPGQLVRSVRW